MNKVFLLVLILLINETTSSAKNGYICEAWRRHNGIWIEDCVNWWATNPWSGSYVWNHWKNGYGFGGRPTLVIFATESEYRGLMDLKKEILSDWEKEQKKFEEQKERIFNAKANEAKAVLTDIEEFDGFKESDPY